MSEKTLCSFHLCTEKETVAAAIKQAARNQNILPAARLEQLLFSYPIDGQTVRFYLLQDRAKNVGVLGFCGPNGLLITQQHFSSADLARLLYYTTAAGDFVTCCDKDSRLLSWRLKQRDWQRFSGDNFYLPRAVCRRKRPALPVQFHSCQPTYDAIAQYWELFQAGFAGFAGRKRDSFYLEQNHLLRHGASQLCGLYDQQGALLCGCEVNLGSPRLRYLYDLTTKKEARNKGLAAALIELAASRDQRPLWLSAQDKFLSDFYTRLGMIKSGKWVQFRRL